MNLQEMVADVMRSRRSVRRFRAEPVPNELIAQIVELATWAPSANNRQDWVFTVVTSEQVKSTMADAVRQRWATVLDENRGSGVLAEIRGYAEGFDEFARAPVVIVVAARVPGALQQRIAGEHARTTAGSFTSAALAAQNLMLAAHANGLGSCCMTGALVAESELKQIIGLSGKEEVVCLVTLGWPAEQPPPPARKPVQAVLRWR